MDIHATLKNDKGEEFNKSGQKIIACKTGCGRKTIMTGTKLCDFCWEELSRERVTEGQFVAMVQDGQYLVASRNTGFGYNDQLSVTAHLNNATLFTAEIYRQFQQRFDLSDINRIRKCIHLSATETRIIKLTEKDNVKT